MKYIFTSPDCSRCESLIRAYKTQGIPFKERPISRMMNPKDDIDQEAFIQLQMQNQMIPVEVVA